MMIQNRLYNNPYGLKKEKKQIDQQEEDQQQEITSNSGNSNLLVQEFCSNKDIQQLLNSNLIKDICQDYTDDSDDDVEEDDDGDQTITNITNHQQLETEQQRLKEKYGIQNDDSSDDSDDSDQDSDDSEYIVEDGDEDEDTSMKDNELNNNSDYKPTFNINNINKKYYADTNSYFYNSRQQQQQQQQPKYHHIYADNSLRMELIEIITVMKNNEREKTIVEDVYVHEIIL